MLVNNSFPNKLIDKIVNGFLEKKCPSDDPVSSPRPSQASSVHGSKSDLGSGAHTDSQDGTIMLYYRNQICDNYKKILKEGWEKILYRDIIPTHPETKLKLPIYYKNKKLKSLFIKKNPHKPSEVSSVVYQYNCGQSTCMVDKISYIGHTTTTIKERFKQHASIKKHYSTVHGINITGQEMNSNVKVIGRAVDKFELCILEALLIKEKNPVINAQVNDFNCTLKIFC